MVHYKLTYFPGRGIAEVVRQVFALAGQEFEDERITFEEWPEYKKNVPFCQLPVLEEDGKTLAQSYAIARYLARKFGFAGKTAWEEAQVDALIDQWKDFNQEIRPYILVLFKSAEGDLEKLKADVLAPAIKKHLPFFANALKTSDNGFLVGESVTFVDLPVAEFVAQFEKIAPELIEPFPELHELKERIHAIPGIKKWRETRPDSHF